jgi:hypothetical protein
MEASGSWLGEGKDRELFGVVTETIAKAGR